MADGWVKFEIENMNVNGIKFGRQGTVAAIRNDNHVSEYVAFCSRPRWPILIMCQVVRCSGAMAFNLIIIFPHYNLRVREQMRVVCSYWNKLSNIFVHIRWGQFRWRTNVNYIRRISSQHSWPVFPSEFVKCIELLLLIGINHSHGLMRWIIMALNRRCYLAATRCEVTRILIMNTLSCRSNCWHTSYAIEIRALFDIGSRITS